MVPAGETCSQDLPYYKVQAFIVKNHFSNYMVSE